MTQPQQSYFDPATGTHYVAVNGQWQAAPTAPPVQPQPAPMAAPATPYPTQYTAQPQYAYAPQGFPAQVFPGQPQTYGMPPGAPQTPAAPPLAQGTLADFYSQPAAGGKSISWSNKPIGTEYLMLVSRAITAGDVQQQTKMNSNVPDTFRDGRPKFVLKVPVKIAPSAEYPDGTAVWFVQGATRDELTRAMTEAGVPLDTEGRPQPPEQGAVIHIQLTGKRPVPNMSPANVVSVRYWRPSDPYAQQVAQYLGSAPVQAPAAVQAAAQPTATAYTLQGQAQYPTPQFPPYATVAPPAPPAPSVPQPPVPQPPAAQAPAAPTAPPAPQAPAPQTQAGPPPPQAPTQSWPAAPGVPQLDPAGQATLQALLSGQVPAAPAG